MKTIQTLSLFFIASFFCQASETLLTTLNEKWVAQNTTDLVNYLDSQLLLYPNDPQILFARGVVAAELEQWARGATNFMNQAAKSLELSDEYNATNNKILLSELQWHLKFFEASIVHFNEPNPSYPQTNSVWQTEIFSGWQHDFPYIEFLQKLDDLKE